MNDLIRDAIRDKRMIEFDYRGHHRVAEPHILGIKNGVEQALVYQVRGGSSSGGLPEWRRVDVAHIGQLTVLDETFPGSRPYPSGKHSQWDITHEIVN